MSWPKYFLLVALLSKSLFAAVVPFYFTFDTENFVAGARTEEWAKVVAEKAEAERERLAILWLGKALPNAHSFWPIYVTTHEGEPFGNTTFRFGNFSPPKGFTYVGGGPKRILPSGVPHEVSHVVLATHFGRAIPRWFDEGAALLSEDAEGRETYRSGAQALLARKRQLPIREFFKIETYPDALHDFYSQSPSLTEFLLRAGGHAKLIRFIDQGMKEGWDKAVKAEYGYSTLEDLETVWLRTVIK